MGYHKSFKRKIVKNSTPPNVKQHLIQEICRRLLAGRFQIERDCTLNANHVSAWNYSACKRCRAFSVQGTVGNGWL